MLRIDFWNIAFIIINLLVLYFFMKHFLIGPVTKIVEERRQMVEKDLDDAARAKEEAGRIKAQYEAAAAGADHGPSGYPAGDGRHRPGGPAAHPPGKGGRRP